MIAQVDKQHAAMVAFAMDPAGQANGLADVGCRVAGRRYGCDRRACESGARCVLNGARRWSGALRPSLAALSTRSASYQPIRLSPTTSSTSCAMYGVHSDPVRRTSHANPIPMATITN